MQKKKKNVKQKTGFYMKQNTRQKRVKLFYTNVSYILPENIPTRHLLA